MNSSASVPISKSLYILVTLGKHLRKVCDLSVSLCTMLSHPFVPNSCECLT